MDDSISKLLGLAVGLMLCLGALGTALHLQAGSSDYIDQVKSAGQKMSLVKEQALNEPLEMKGFELIAAIAHQLRLKDVQLDNADIVFDGSLSGGASYVVDGNPIDLWSKLLLIDSSKYYRISYKITGVGVIEGVICEGID